MSAQKSISIEDFWKEGYLQELNRQFLHPLGLNLSIINTNNKLEFNILDSRDSPEGLYYNTNDIKLEDAININREWSKRATERENALGYIIQPLP